MNKDYDRCIRIGDQIQRILATVLTVKIKDPRLQLVSVTEVRVSRDLRNATVFYVSMGQVEKKALETAMDKAAGLLTHEVSVQMESKRIPHLKFVHDDQLKKGNDLQALIEKAVEADSKKIQDDHE